MASLLQLLPLFIGQYGLSATESENLNKFLRADTLLATNFGRKKFGRVFFWTVNFLTLFFLISDKFRTKISDTSLKHCLGTDH